MKLVCHRKVEYKTYVHDFENGFLYVEEWENNRLKDDFFVKQGDLYIDGSVKPDRVKYFYSPFDLPKAKKEVGNVKLKRFKYFDRLFFVNGDGVIERIKNKA